MGTIPGRKLNSQTCYCIPNYEYTPQVIPRTLAQNCGASVVRAMTQLRAKHFTDPDCRWGINGCTGELEDMLELGIWEPHNVKTQTFKTAIEAACMILRIDDVVSGIAPKKKQ